MSMPSDMDMGGMNMNTDSQGSESSMGTSPLADAKTSHVMTRMEMVADVEHAAEIKSGAMNPSDRLSSCAHDACNQMAISSIWVNSHHFQPNVLHWIAINFSSHLGLLPTFYPTRLGTPPKIPAADRLVTTLRI